MSEATRDEFDGELVTTPFGAQNAVETAGDCYADLIDAHDPEDVLVLVGTPTSPDRFRERLDGVLPGAAVPRVSSLVVHATDVLDATDDRAVLSDAHRRELLHRFLDGYEWSSDYLRRASAQPSFVGDVDRVLDALTWEAATPTETPELGDIAAARDAFHAWLADGDHVTRGQLIPEALAALREDPGVADAEAVLCVEFEEFGALDRAYLDALAAGRDLVCVAEEHASVRRTWVEAGPIDDHVAFREERRAEPTTAPTRPAATAAYFAAGTVADDPGAGAVSVLAAESSDDEIDAVADEIEALRRRDGWAYDDIAVATAGSADGVSDTLEALEAAGVPTASSTVVGFGDDPAVRELLAVAERLAGEGADGSEGTTVSDTTDGNGDGADDGVTGDAAAVRGGPALDESLLAAVAGMDGLEAPLRRWATESGLKERIAERADPLDARAQFGNVRRALRTASFLEDTDFCEATWASYATALERAHEYASGRGRTSATDRVGGVRVERLGALKNGSFRAVFLLDLVDGVSPGDPSLTRLFPTARAAAMPDYPGVTDVDGAAVDATFPTDSTASGRAFARYHAEHARRRLAVGAAAATERLYGGLYAYEDTALEERAHASRFLAAAYDDLSWVSEADGAGVASERAAEAYLLSRVDDALADVRRAGGRDADVSLDDVEADLAAIAELLDASGERGEDLRRALRARVEFAAGEVRR